MNGPSKTPSFIRHFRKSIGVIPLALILLASTFGAGHANAGVFSIFSTASGKTETESSTTIQKMKILEVVFSPTLNGQGGEDIITDESALIANDTPLSNITDGQNSSAGGNSDNSNSGDQSVDHDGDSSIRTYKVKSGDTLSTIAEKNGVSINTIVWANNLDRKATLKVGETLTILPVSGIQYTVRRGDTIDSIAKKYGAETTDIQDFNDITNASLIAGVKIIVPGAELSPTVETKVATTKTVTVPKVAVVAPVAQNVSDSPIQGTLIRPKTNTGDSSDFIRPITEGVGRKSQGVHDKWAVDIAAPIGTPIHAAASGTVILVKPVGYNGGYGKYVAIEHDGGIQTLYAHMTLTKVEVGQVVSQGDVIGLVGSTGRSTGPHVHYEVRGAPNNCFVGCE